MIFKYYYDIVSNLEYQAIRLNRVNNSKTDELQTGVYCCEIMDKENIIHSLFVGIYPENEGIIICTHELQSIP
jgi:hypothetical protein